jgi:hypothetical protein
MARRAEIKVKWPLIAIANDRTGSSDDEEHQLGAVDTYILKLVREGAMHIPVEFVSPDCQTPM